ncbi:MAG: TROVE domain-containing protein [Anaerolineae bacterium]|nr:TROVE domain-containing protein [Anaerolineae bacterium]
MVRVLDKFNVKKNVYAKADGRNPEGFPSFEHSLEEAYLQVLLTNTLTGTFYATEKKLLDESLSLHAEMALTDPGFMARAIVYARREGLMRLQPVVGLAYLAKADQALFKSIFSRVILTPGDLTDFIEIARGGVVPGGIGRAIKSAVNDWLNGLSEYHAIKYARGGQGYSLRDILRLSHPKPAGEVRDAIFMWLTDAEKWQSTEKQALTPQITAFERLKRLDNGNSQAEARRLIDEGRLPYEVVTGVLKPDVETWRVLMRQMPYLALLRHLNTLQRAGVLADGEAARYVAERLSSEEALRRARVLPFQIFMAYRMFEPVGGSEQQVANALADALEASLVNMPTLDGICIAPDVSGSMTGQLTRQGKTRYADVAGIFAAALFRASPNARVLPFRERVVETRLNQRDSLMTTAERINQLVSGGTAISAPISYLLDHKVMVSSFIGITDNIEWAADQSGNLGFLPTWHKYKNRVAPDARAFLLTIAPYRHAVAPTDEPDVHYIYGWNDVVLKYIGLMLEGLDGQVETVRAMEM